MTRERPGGFGDRPIRTWRVHGYGAWAGRAGDTDPSAFRVGVGGSAAGQAKDTRPVRDTRCDAVRSTALRDCIPGLPPLFTSYLARY